MRLTIAAIGSAKNHAAQPLIDDYSARIQRSGPQIGLQGLKISDAEAPKALSGETRLAAEAKLLTRAIVGNSNVAESKSGNRFAIALDERGKNLTSEKFAALIAEQRDTGRQELAFLIGGADGLHPSLQQIVDMRIAFGAMTWPHLLVRAMLVEQIYRAVTILSGHPYHRA